MEVEYERYVRLTIKTDEINNLDKDIASLQVISCPDDVSLFEDNYPTLYKLWALLSDGN